MRLIYHSDAEVELIEEAQFYERRVPALGAPRRIDERRRAPPCGLPVAVFLAPLESAVAELGVVGPLTHAMKAIAISLFVAITTFAFAADTWMDDKLAAKAEVVLRVKRLSVEGADKYAWYRVEVLQVLKNLSSETFTNTLSVAASSWKAGVPDGESTLYLERYNQTDAGLWKLVGGEASTGVSHVRKP